jgi:uncharacterized protein YndB with AHSA1/START domain
VTQLRVERTVELACGTSEAFERFTVGIGDWWPLRAGFSFGGDRCDSIHLEPRVGGRFYERFVDGDEFQVGVVTACEPPHRIVFTWAPPIWPGATEVEVRFVSHGEDASGTVVHLEHRGFENLGAESTSTRDEFGNGWVRVLDSFRRHTAGDPLPGDSA